MKMQSSTRDISIKEKTNVIIANSEEQKERQFVNLIAKIIVDLTFKQAYEKGNTLSEIQQ